MSDGQVFTRDQIRAGALLWETEVRATREAFKSEVENRSTPLEEQADAYTDALIAYIERAGVEAVPAVYVLFEEVSDQCGTDRVVGVYASKELAEANQSSSSRSYVCEYEFNLPQGGRA